MQNYTLKITEKNAKTAALIKYLKTLDFIEISKSLDWWNELGEESKASIERGLDDLKKGEVHSDQDVRNLIRKRILRGDKE